MYQKKLATLTQYKEHVVRKIMISVARAIYEFLSHLKIFKELSKVLATIEGENFLNFVRCIH